MVYCYGFLDMSLKYSIQNTNKPLQYKTVDSANIQSFINITMGNHTFFEVTLTVFVMHLFVQLFICRKPIFTENDHFNHFEFDCKNETENVNSYNKSMYPNRCNSMNTKKTYFDFHDFDHQQLSILNGTNCLYNALPKYCLCNIKQMHMYLVSNAQLNLMNLSLISYVSTQVHLTIFKHTHSIFFPRSTQLCSIFVFSQYYTNFYCFTNTTSSSIAIVLLILYLFHFSTRQTLFRQNQF